MWRDPAKRDRLNLLLLAAALIAAAAALAVQLFVPPVVGLADNGDYQRVMGYAGFRHTTFDDAERYFGFLRTHYEVVRPFWFRSGYHSSETPLAFAARGVDRALFGGEDFDLRTLAAIHAALFLLALAGLLRACRDLAPAAQAVVAGLLVFVFTDVGYVAPFNSFYSQTASLLFLLLTAAAAAEGVRRGRLQGGWVLAYFAAALLFVGSKPQERLAAPLLALYGMRLAATSWRAPWRSVAAWLAVGVCAFSVWYGRHTPYTLREATMFQLVFDDVLGHSARPAEDAAELGLDPAWVPYVGTSPYAKDSPLLEPEFRTRFLHTVGYRKVLRFYARHPARLADRLERASREMWNLRPPLGNFERSAAHPEAARATAFGIWSGMRARLGAHPIPWAVLLLGGSLAAAVGGWRHASTRGRLFREGVVLLIAMASFALAVCALAQAPPDLSRALYAYHALCDLLLIADAGWCVQAVADRWSSKVLAERTG
jgi:hypothetical protein